MALRSAAPALAALALAACAPTGPPAARPADPLAGLERGPTVAGASPALAPVIASRTQAPLASALTPYRDRAAARPAVTVTLVTYADAKGARILLNGFFAERAFPAAAERRGLAIGEEAEGVDLGWPAYHAVYARSGPHFVLAEAAPALGPPERRAALLEWLAAEALAVAAAADGPARTPAATPEVAAP